MQNWLFRHLQKSLAMALQYGSCLSLCICARFRRCRKCKGPKESGVWVLATEPGTSAKSSRICLDTPSRAREALKQFSRGENGLWMNLGACAKRVSPPVSAIFKLFTEPPGTCRHPPQRHCHSISMFTTCDTHWGPSRQRTARPLLAPWPTGRSQKKR